MSWGAIGEIPVLLGCEKAQAPGHPGAAPEPTPPLGLCLSFSCPLCSCIFLSTYFGVCWAPVPCPPPIRHASTFPHSLFIIPLPSLGCLSGLLLCLPSPQSHLQARAGSLQSGPPRLSAHQLPACLCGESTQPWRQGVGWLSPLQARCCLYIQDAPTHAPIPVGELCTD